MWIAIGAGVGVVVLLAVVFVIIRSRRSSGPVSIVMLRLKPRGLKESDVRGGFRRAFGGEPEITKLPMPDGLTDAYLCVTPEGPPLGIIDSRRGYLDKDEVERTAKALEHEVAREAMLNHAAWVSVDAMGVGRLRREQRAVVYAHLGKMAAELYDDGCTLLYLPADGRIAQPGPGVEQQLRNGQIAELFGDDELHAPMHHVEKDDAKINAAMEEARRRLPEFLGAFERLGPEASMALFKARFPTEGDGNEYIWMKLLETTSSHLVGTIENRPVAKNLPPKGSKQSIAIDDVVDWAYIDEKKKPQGLFVDRILLKRTPGE